jgi:hypothetical protein
MNRCLDNAIAKAVAEFDYQRHAAATQAEATMCAWAFSRTKLQVVYSVRSERLLMEQRDYNLLFRWFVGLHVDDKVWDHSTFSFNRDRLFDKEIEQRFFEHTMLLVLLLVLLVLLARLHEWVSDDHFSVDGTLLEAWASHKSFRPKDDNDKGDGSDFHGQKRSNDTHASRTDPDARLIRKGKGKEPSSVIWPTR